MKTLYLIPLFLFASETVAQTRLVKNVPVKSGQQLRVTFDYPELIRVSTWDGNEISIEGNVSINEGESDAAFVLDVSTSAGVIDIRGRIKDIDDLPKRITVVKDGKKMVFRNDGEWKKYKQEHGKSGFDMTNHGIEIDITLDIKVPARMATTVVSVYGMVEVKQFNGPLRVEATYGGVDVSLTESATGELKAETNYGHIYSDLSLELDRDGIREEDFHTVISAKPGKGHTYSFVSQYGNVYLRKSK